MKRLLQFAFTALILAASATTGLAAQGGSIPVPAGLDPRFSANFSAERDPSRILQAFLGIAYREDGVINDQGKYATFQAPNTVLPAPGLNCSGFVLEASRFLLRSNISVEAAKRDRLGDSGPTSPMGEDWDFGWDIILNIAEGRPHTLLMPGGKTADPSRLSGRERGYDLHTAATWAELPSRFRPGYLYLVSISKPATRPGYTLQHYHVGLIWVSPERDIWYYHTTGAANRVNRRNLAVESDRASFLKAFANSGKARKSMVVLEVALPK